MAVAFSSIPVGCHNLASVDGYGAVLVPSRDACVSVSCMIKYTTKFVLLPFCFDDSDEPPEPPDGYEYEQSCMSNPAIPQEIPKDEDGNPNSAACDTPFWEIPKDAGKVSLNYSGMVKGRTYQFSIYAVEVSIADDVSEEDKEAKIREYPFSFTATAESGTIKDALEILPDQDKMVCCYADWSSCNIGEKAVSGGGESEDAG